MNRITTFKPMMVALLSLGLAFATGEAVGQHLLALGGPVIVGVVDLDASALGELGIPLREIHDFFVGTAELPDDEFARTAGLGRRQARPSAPYI